MIFLVDLVMTLALANGRDAQSPLAMMRMWSSRPKDAFNQVSGKVAVSPIPNRKERKTRKNKEKQGKYRGPKRLEK